MLKLSPDKLFLRKLWITALQSATPLRLPVSSFKEATRYRFALYELAKQVRGEQKALKDPALGEAVEACQVNIDRTEGEACVLVIQRKLLAPGLVELQAEFAKLQASQGVVDSAANSSESTGTPRATSYLDQADLEAVQASLRKLQELGLEIGATGASTIPQPNSPRSSPTSDPQADSPLPATGNPYYTR